MSYKYKMLRSYFLSIMVQVLLLAHLTGGDSSPVESSTSGGTVQEVSPSMELTQLRNAWLLERKMSQVRLDLGYQDSLEALRERALECKDEAALVLVEEEINQRKAQFAEARAELPIKQAATPIKPSIPRRQAALLAGKLIGQIWRVDHEGEGLRWYYFAQDGKLARKSRLTNWVWTDLSGTWRLDPRGIIEIRSEGPIAQVLVGDDGEPVIAINRQGSLSQRPFKETDLDYPGEGRE